jgi:Lipocalin-like domain
MCKEDLLNRLLGTWQLVSSVVHFENGVFYDQFGHNPSGFLIYTADGYVSAVLGASNRPLLATNEPGIATDAEFASEASNFIAYCGRFTVDDKTKSVSHEMAACLFPNWVGLSEKRAVTFIDDQLILLTDFRTRCDDGRRYQVEVTWKRPAQSAT